MEHRGIQYQVVQTACPTGWKWTVQLDEGRTKTGVSFSTQYAIFDATNAIEIALGASDTIGKLSCLEGTVISIDAPIWGQAARYFFMMKLCRMTILL